MSHRPGSHPHSNSGNICSSLHLLETLPHQFSTVLYVTLFHLSVEPEIFGITVCQWASCNLLHSQYLCICVLGISSWQEGEVWVVAGSGFLHQIGKRGLWWWYSLTFLWCQRYDCNLSILTSCWNCCWPHSHSKVPFSVPAGRCYHMIYIGSISLAFWPC